MNKLILIISIALININNTFSNNPELVIGEKRVDPGIVFIFEGAIKDHVMPMSMHLAENETHVHIEARVNWDSKNVPKGTVPGGFVPYMYINAKVTNEKTGLSTFIDLVPHINLIDNFHYARNISLPGSIDDLYTVIFNVIPPTNMNLSLHKDWLDNYGNKLFDQTSFKYKSVNFKEIAESSRK
tara:strand:+ start:289 stop:840 length:552 start_codon:yes stop_codon:yes gene_type:complete